METDDTTQGILYYVQHLAVLIGRQSDQILQEQLGIGLSQFRILQTLQANTAIQQKQVASLLGLTEASVSRQAKIMLTKGMIFAKVNPQNRREHLLVISPKGERLLAAGVQIVSQYHYPTMDKLKAKDRNAFLERLMQLHAEMCQVDGLEGVLHVGKSRQGVV
jgi:DNA-binding MarR family transcriptional regulator